MASDPDAMLQEGEAALRAIDKVLRDKPAKVGHDFSDTITHLSQLRDSLIARHRAAESEEGELPRLGRLNAVLTVMIAGHYPLGKVPWPHIEKARESFAALLSELAKAP
jgi:hypothetical protein